MAQQSGYGSQTVEQMMRQHFLRVTHRGQVVDLVPLLQQIHEGHEQINLCRSQLQLQRLNALFELGTQCLAHADASSFCAAKPLKPPFFR